MADNAKDAFNELFKANEPVISSYISTKGVRKVLLHIRLMGLLWMEFHIRGLL